MKKSKLFLRAFILLFAIIIPLACGSDDNGGTPPVVDVEALYTVSSPKEVKNYTSGESLATVSDADGAITKATLQSGSNLPAGTALNGTTGELTVSDVAALVAGTYSIGITTEDANGGTTDHTISVVLNANNDTAAEYAVIEAKAIQDYTMGESIATAADADGDIVGATLESGSELPAGTALNATTGEITVDDPTLLVPGTYEFNIVTEDALGGSTVNMVSITFNTNPDVDSVYSVTEAKSVEDYEAQESIATVTDDNGEITSAVLGNGSELPAGTALNATTGEITATDPALLVPGTYTFEITTEDVFEGSTTQSVTLVFDENPIRVNINSGGDEFVSTDITYSADQFFIGTSMPFTPADPKPAIEGTDDDELYLTERFGTDFGYEIALDNGTYKVTLHFVELFWGAPGLGSAGGAGDRVFDVSLEGVIVVNDYDIFADVGALTATTREFEVSLNDGTLNIGFLASADNAKIAAIQIEEIK